MSKQSRIAALRARLAKLERHAGNPYADCSTEELLDAAAAMAETDPECPADIHKTLAAWERTPDGWQRR